jgi:hypothetical protein
LGVIDCLAYQLEGDQAAIRYNTNAFKNGAIPSSIVNVKEFVPDNVFEEIKAGWIATYGGNANSNKTAFVRGGTITVDPVTRTQTDMQFLEGRQWTREEIFAVMGVPLGKYSENATEANATVADATFIKETIWPQLVMVAEEITAKILHPLYGPEYVVQFEDIRPQDKQLWLSELTAVAGGAIDLSGGRAPIMTVDEIRERFYQLGPIEDTLKAEGYEYAAVERPAGDADDDGDTREPPASEDDEDAEEERRQWRRKALNALRRGKPAAVLFESKALPTHERLHIEQSLETATTAEEVRSAFADAPFCGELDWQGYP